MPIKGNARLSSMHAFAGKHFIHLVGVTRQTLIKPEDIDGGDMPKKIGVSCQLIGDNESQIKILCSKTNTLCVGV